MKYLEPEDISALSNKDLQQTIDKTECIIEETMANGDATVDQMEILQDNIINLVLEHQMRYEKGLIKTMIIKAMTGEQS